MLDYYKLISKKIGLHANDGTNILYNQLNKISFVDKNTVLARYIEPQKIYVKSPKDTVIFPFGCNLSQMTAVSNAVANKIKEWHPDMEVKIASAQGLADCKKLLMLAKAGKYNGYLLEGMGCPGGCIGGAGTIADPARTAIQLNKYMKEAPFTDPEQSPYMSEIHVLKDDPNFEL